MLLSELYAIHFFSLLRSFEFNEHLNWIDFFSFLFTAQFGNSKRSVYLHQHRLRALKRSVARPQAQQLIGLLGNVASCKAKVLHEKL